MTRVLAIVAAIILTMGLHASIAAQVDEEDCWPLPNLDDATKCDVRVFATEDPNDTDFEMIIIFRIEYKSEKVADATFDEVKETSASPESDTEIPLKPTKEYKRLGISDAIQGEDDEGTVVVFRDDKAIIMMSGNIEDDLRTDVIKIVVEEDEIPEEIEGLEPFE